MDFIIEEPIKSKKYWKAWNKYLKKTYLVYSSDDGFTSNPMWNDDRTMMRRFIKTDKLAKFNKNKIKEID